MADGTIGKLLEKIVPPSHSCGALATGWLNDSHPEEPGQITTATVCFHWSSKSCFRSKSIQIRHCGPYFLYLLPDTVNCHYRYCSEKQIDQ